MKRFGKHVWSSEERIKAMKTKWLKMEETAGKFYSFVHEYFQNWTFIPVQQTTAEFHKRKGKKKWQMVLGTAHNFTPALTLYHFKTLWFARKDRKPSEWFWYLTKKVNIAWVSLGSISLRSLFIFSFFFFSSLLAWFMFLWLITCYYFNAYLVNVVLPCVLLYFPAKVKLQSIKKVKKFFNALDWW